MTRSKTQKTQHTGMTSSQQPENSNMKKNLNSTRRQLLGGTALSATAIALTSAWTKPVVESMVLPAHAMTSCPPIVVDDVFITTPSPQDQNSPVCGITFDIFSGDPDVPITIVSIETTSLMASETVTFDVNLGEATSTDGIRVIWTGPAAGAPFCNADSQPFMDLDFVITAECEAIPGFQYSDTITLLELYALAELGNPV